ncbi:MAG: thiamine-phosphate kinase [candidate division KSB1 bacterium]|nr:thiamine-phosphate kinase [candidate division KSB1 bacterium]MDZ7318298.1 thiamine-phosphate kinase [candidate division KSB1 bacterium]MDZ7342446.1 thiamine-phosphate kinase [candidate division KSB1 bacterium]
MESVANIGEWNLIRRIQNMLPAIENPEVMVGIGDDAAVLRLDDRRSLLLTCDIQVENQHFRLRQISPYQLGRRAMAVNLSDIAAMGGQPTLALVSLGFPPDFPAASFDALISGLRDQLAEFSAHIIGGNLSRTSKELIIDITLLGEAPIHQVLTRSGARAGDRIFVTGRLGESAAGWQALEKFGPNCPREFEPLVQKHLQPIPRIAAGRLIAQSGFATSMIDISDGLASDLHHICSASGVGAEIYQDQLPIPQNIELIAALSSLPVPTLVLHRGEDYELLFTLRPDTPIAVVNSIIQTSGVSITEVGRILPKEAGLHLISPDRQSQALQPTGWNHFRKDE